VPRAVISPHFDLWNYFFYARLKQGSDVEAAVLGSVDLLVRSESGVDPYFHLLMSNPPARWWKVWFFLRNDADALLPVVTGSHPIPQHKWGYGVAQIYICRLQSLCDVVQQLL
jgi:hypothetical protein